MIDGRKIDMTLEELAVKVQVVDDRSLRNEGRIKKLEAGNDALQALTTRVAVMEMQLKQILDNIALLSKKIEQLETKPAKRLESIADKILWALVAAVLGFVLAHLGIST